MYKIMLQKQYFTTVDYQIGPLVEVIQDILKSKPSYRSAASPNQDQSAWKFTSSFLPQAFQLLRSALTYIRVLYRLG